MSRPWGGIEAANEFSDSGEGLREALLRLTNPRYLALQRELSRLQKQLDTISSLADQVLALQQLSGQYKEDLEIQAESIHRLIGESHEHGARLKVTLEELERAWRDEIESRTVALRGEITAIHDELSDPERVSERIEPVVVPVIAGRVREDRPGFAQAVAPVIGPAIRHQIREAREDIIDALYPIIGQIISKAIAESIRELSRNIDARLRRQLDFRTQVGQMLGRLQGVSRAELVLRDALPFALQHVFLIHRETGLLLQHLSPVGEQPEADTISGMLTAIQDFVRDSFGGTAGDLEEITHGDQRILLEGGQYAYLAVVLSGVEPRGYNEVIGQTIHEVNLRHERDLRTFTGEMDRLPDFSPVLEPLYSAGAMQDEADLEPPPLGRGQKILALIAVLALIALVASLALACIFTIRLWPLVFP